MGGMKRMMCLVDLGPVGGLADMAGVDLNEVAQSASGIDVSGVSGGVEGAAGSAGTASVSSMASGAAASGMDAQGAMIGDPLAKKAGTDAQMKDYKKVKDEAMDIQLGEGFTTSQKWGSLLYVLYEMKEHQF